MKKWCEIKSWLHQPVIILMAAFILISNSSNALAARQILWESRDQFVALEPQDRIPSEQKLPNAHPAEIPVETLSAQLASLTVRTAETRKITPLFTAAAIELIADKLQLALSKATPEQDVTFAVIGLHTALYGFAKSPKVTTGRIFSQGGKLNLIIGQMQQDVNERADRRLEPFVPGSRLQSVSDEWALQPQPEQDSFKLLRKDWVAFGETWKVPVIIPPVVAQPTAVPAAVQPVTEKQPVPATSSTTAPVTKSSEAQRVSDRLTTIKELQEKGLITIEEYRDKRREILNGL
ncbi:MAG TPA: SHOCT domain-containing protein [Desulfuromonadales bacterium]|nr:SHOCT domain-containing protein [Desulfuromonadales bacterium]